MFSYPNSCMNPTSISQYVTTMRLSPKKKRRKYSNDGQHINANSQCLSNNPTSNFNISIIDRVLDLNKYDKTTGLYTLCRDWVNATTSINDSVKQTTDENDEKMMEVDEVADSYFITKLPEPIKENPLPITIKDLNESIKVNIRVSEKSDLELIKALNVNEDETIQTHALLKLHMNRWKSARKEWVNFYAESNKPYKNSMDILNSILEDI